MTSALYALSSGFTASWAGRRRLKKAVVSGHSGLKKPTSAEYAKETVKGFLDLVDSIAQQIPIPGFGIAVKTAANIIKICEESRGTLDKAEELAQSIKALVEAVANELKRRKSDELGEALKEDIEALQRELKYVEKVLGEIVDQSPIRLVLFKSLNDEKVQGCMDHLDRLLHQFSVVRHIDHAGNLQRLENKLDGTCETQRETLELLKTLSKVDDTGFALGKDLSPVDSSPSSGTRAAVPANTIYFCGREAIVTNLVTQLTATSRSHEGRHVCILGPGGMGKTSTALAVMVHPDIKRCYSNRDRVWVPCVQATSSALFLDTLSSSLGITKTKSVRDNILATLQASSPMILLLDNFETPWNVEGGRSAAEQMLRDIAEIPHITLFVTMRSSAPPKGTRWYSVDLEALDAEAASLIYSDIHPQSVEDPKVPELLKLVGYMPLAVTLMAASASLGRLRAEYLLEKFHKVGTAMLGQGSDAEHNMDICIGLSVDSSPMKRHPEARWLLGVLALLPVGTTLEMLDKWWARSLSNVSGALEVLREAALVQLQGLTFVVLPVIQRYVLDSSRLDPDILTSMIGSACDFLIQHNSVPGENLYNEHYAALSAEEGNLEAVLSKALTPSVPTIRALLVLAQHHRLTRPRTGVVEHALKLVAQMKNNASLHADVLECYADLCHTNEDFQESQRYSMEARELFLAVHDIRSAAKCLLHCVQIDVLVGSIKSEHTQSLISKARSEYESIGDDEGIVRCWNYLGMLLCGLRLYPIAIYFFRRAHDEFARLKRDVLSVHCLAWIATCYYYMGEYKQAEPYANSAKHELDRLGYVLGMMDAVCLLGLIYAGQGQYDAALKELVPFHTWLKNTGRPGGGGWISETIGIAWMYMGEVAKAQQAFQEALKTYPVPGNSNGRHCCRYLIRRADDSCVEPTPEERDALVRCYPRLLRELLNEK